MQTDMQWNYSAEFIDNFDWFNCFGLDIRNVGKNCNSQTINHISCFIRLFLFCEMRVMSVTIFWNLAKFWKMGSWFVEQVLWSSIYISLK